MKNISAKRLRGGCFFFAAEKQQTNQRDSKNDIDQYLNSTIDTTQKIRETTPKAIFDYLKEHPTATRQEVAEALGNITEDGIKYHFSRLQKKGYLKREGGRKLGHWVVADWKPREADFRDSVATITGRVWWQNIWSIRDGLLIIAKILAWFKVR